MTLDGQYLGKALIVSSVLISKEVYVNLELTNKSGISQQAHNLLNGAVFLVLMTSRISKHGFSASTASDLHRTRGGSTNCELK